MNEFSINGVKFDYMTQINLGVLYNSYDHDFYIYHLVNYGNYYEITLNDTLIGMKYVIGWNKGDFSFLEIAYKLANKMLLQRGLLTE